MYDIFIAYWIISTVDVDFWNSRPSPGRIPLVLNAEEMAIEDTLAPACVVSPPASAWIRITS